MERRNSMVQELHNNHMNPQGPFMYDESLLIKSEYDYSLLQQGWMMNSLVPQPPQLPPQPRNDYVFHSNTKPTSKRQVRKRVVKHQDKEKREQFLERNRQAALKCRQRKKKWLEELQNLVEFLNTDNQQLQTQADFLKEEVLNLKTLLLAHVNCKVAQANGTTAEKIQNVYTQS